MSEILMRDDHYLQGALQEFPGLVKQAGRKISDIVLPESCVIALIERGGKMIMTTPETQLHSTDELVIIGEPKDLIDLHNQELSKITRLSSDSDDSSEE